MGPPTTKRPVGFTYTSAFSQAMPSASMTGAITWRSMSSRMTFMSSTAASCCVEITMVVTSTGLPFS